MGTASPRFCTRGMLGAPSVGTPVVLEVYKQMSEKGESKKADLLASVTDSLGATTEVTYAPMSDRSVFSRPPKTAAIRCTAPAEAGGW